MNRRQTQNSAVGNENKLAKISKPKTNDEKNNSHKIFKSPDMTDQEAKDWLPSTYKDNYDGEEFD